MNPVDAAALRAAPIPQPAPPTEIRSDGSAATIARRLARVVDRELPEGQRPARLATADLVASEILPLVAWIVDRDHGAGERSLAPGVELAETLLRDGLPRRLLLRALDELDRIPGEVPARPPSTASRIADRLSLALVPEEVMREPDG